MSILDDIRILYHLALAPKGGDTHAERLERFYGGQATGYDDFRRRLLKGRQTLMSALPAPEGGVWVDMGGGTGANLEFFGDERLAKLKKVTIVDLSPSLLDVARRRIEERGWTNVEAIEADATRFEPAVGQADLVTFSYSLTMIPDWFRAIDHARTILKPGGVAGVVDFYVSRKHPAEGRRRHGWPTRTFWPAWFAMDNVFLNPDHLPFLENRFEAIRIDERRARVPYVPLGRVPVYLFLGRKA